MRRRNTYVKTPTVIQMEASECGAASLAMILSYYGQEVSLEKLRVETDVTRDGCNAGNLIRAARNRGFFAEGFRKTAESLFDIDAPCIIFWEHNHFVVYEGVRGGSVYINDPAFGERKMSTDEFRRHYSGIVLRFAPQEEPARKPGAPVIDSTMRRTAAMFRDEIKQEAKAFAAILLLSMMMAAAGITAALNMNRLLILIPCAAAALLSFFLTGFILSGMQRRYTAVESNRFLEKLFALPLSFFDQRYPGDITERVSGEERAGQYISGACFWIVYSALAALAFLVALCAVDIGSAVMGIALTAIALAAAALVIKRQRLAQNRKQVSVNKMAGRLFAAISNTEMIKSTGSQALYEAEGDGPQMIIEEADREIDRNMLLVYGIVAAGQVLGLLAISLTWLLTRDIGMAATDIVSTMTLFCFFAAAADLTAFKAGSYRNVEMDMRRKTDVNEYLPEVTEETRQYQKLSGNIAIDNVSFGYGTNDEPVVKDFSRVIGSGKSVGITGGTGSGKSTVLKLIAGLYEPDSGEIYFDKKKRGEISREVFDTSIAFAMQKPQLFPGSIRDNISMWNPSVREEDMVRAAKDACIHDVIMEREGGYDSPVVDNGSNFSGGQKQRLEIARALAGDPSILIMDEITSAQDKNTAEMLMRNIQKRGCTCIIVSQQESVINSCDEVIAM